MKGKDIVIRGQGEAWEIEARHEPKYQTNKCEMTAGTWLGRRSIRCY